MKKFEHYIKFKHKKANRNFYVLLDMQRGRGFQEILRLNLDDYINVLWSKNNTVEHMDFSKLHSIDKEFALFLSNYHLKYIELNKRFVKDLYSICYNEKEFFVALQDYSNKGGIQYLDDEIEKKNFSFYFKKHGLIYI